MDWQHIDSSLEGKVSKRVSAYGEETLWTTPEHILSVLKFLRDDKACDFSQLIDLCGVDYPENTEARFEIVYHLLSLAHNARVRVKIAVADAEQVPSAVSLFDAANWFEREAFDMYGVHFSAHPDLRRLLTDYGFDGYPLRKDFPLSGNVEVRYDPAQQKIVYEPVSLPQEFRDFDFESPWEGVKTSAAGGAASEKESK